MIARLAAVAVAALALAGPAAAACTHPRTTLAHLEGQIMCPTCHTTLDQSNAPAAMRIKVFIQQRIDQCATADQIKANLVENFGAGILAAPPRKGFDLLAWWLPIGGLVLGAAAIGIGVWRWSRRDESEPPQSERGLDPELERRVDEALAGFDR